MRVHYLWLFLLFDRRQTPADIELDIMCSCSDYLKSTKCLHYDSVFMDVSNKLRIYGLGIRGINASCVQYDIDVRDSLRIPALDGDNIYVWQIFRQESISSIFQSSATVLHDIKRQRRRLIPLRERLSCYSCHGVSTNRMPCVHETELIPLADIVDQNLCTSSGTEYSMGNDDSDAESDDAEENLIEAGVENEADMCYTSRMKRSFFSCKADETSVHRLMSVILNYKPEVKKEDLFVVRDVLLKHIMLWLRYYL